ncbi:unnamed protein product [Cochlearia groenlandica]
MKKKLDTRFPATRIKKIMQTDEDVGKIAKAVPLLVSKALELFLQDLCNHTYDVTLSRGAKTLSSFHLKQCVNEFNIFDFLKDIVSKVPDLVGSESDDRSATKRRKVVNESSCNHEDTKTTHMNVELTSSFRGRTGSGQSLKLVDDTEDASPESSMSLSPENWRLYHDDDASCKKVSTQKKHIKKKVKVRNFDLNVGLDENGECATTNETKIEPDQEVSCSEEDYDEEEEEEESIDE